MKESTERIYKFIGAIIASIMFLSACAGTSSAPISQSTSRPLSSPTGSTVQPSVAPPTTITSSTSNVPPTFIAPPTFISPPASTILSTSTSDPTPTIATTSEGIPIFKHVIWIVMENRNYKTVVDNQQLPNFDKLAKQDVLFTNYYAVTHPSLPNYIALISGSTYGISSDCYACYLNETNLADLLESHGRTWKAYEESMPSPCYVGGTQSYDKNHDPFIYFDSIRTNQTLCQNHIVPFSQLSQDLKANQLPNFAFITPNICHDAHNCSLTVADTWLGQTLKTLQSSPALGKDYAIFIVFDEASADNSSCCGLGPSAGGRVAAYLVSPLAKASFQDSTSLDHYSLLKTLLLAWSLPSLGMTKLPETNAITKPWRK